MKIFDRRPWYAEGLAFECIRCGRCCAGPEEGYVWIADQEIMALAELLKMTVQQVDERYLHRVGKRCSLVENPKTKDCVFLHYDSQHLSICAIYAARPTQCRTWPFWPANLVSPSAWALAGLRCPGINRGRLHDLDEIQRQRERTDA